MNWRLILAFGVLVALGLSGFGHRMLSPEDAVQADRYLLAGGAWEDLCAEGGPQPGHLSDCDACVISKSLLQPKPTAATQCTPLSLAADWPMAPHVRLRRDLSWHVSARGPPFA